MATREERRLRDLIQSAIDESGRYGWDHPSGRSPGEAMASAFHMLSTGFSDAPQPSPQESWFALRRQHGEAEARRLLVAKLRAFVDQIERGGDPDIFGCEVDNPGELPCAGSTMESVHVILSHPWGG